MLPLVITDLVTASELATSARWTDRVISIRTPGDPRPAWLSTRRAHALPLVFDDHGSRLTPGRPTLAHVGRAVRFARTSGAPLLVHCTAGVSRSTGIALVLLADRLGDPERACEVLDSTIIASRGLGWRRHERCRPNRLVVRLGDALLGLDGALLAARDRWWVLRWQDRDDAWFGHRRTRPEPAGG